MIPAGATTRWISARPRSVRLLFAAAAGMAGAFGQAPWDLPVVLLLALAGGFLLLRCQKTPVDAALLGWAFGAGYFALALHWITEPFQVDAARHGWMAPFALVFLSAGLGLFWAMAFWGARKLSARTWPLVFTWTAAELARAYIFTGFPWATPSQALVGVLAGQGFALVGPYGMMLWLMASAWALSLPELFRGRVALRTVQGGAIAAAFLLLLVPPGAAPPVMTGHYVRLVQPNAEQHLKWQPDHVRIFYERQLALTARPAAPGTPSPALVVWPETAVPWRLRDAAPVFEQIRAVTQAQVALGILRDDGQRLRNAMVVSGPEGGQQVYDKHHLVPFGEYMPLSPLADWIGLTALAATGIGFAPGPGPGLLDFGDLGMGMPLICYEAVFAHDVNAAPSRPAFLLQVTNDAWFGSFAGPHQHLAQARMRAVEQGLPLLRAANTGVSAVIGPRGRVLADLPLGVADALDAPLPAPLAPTLYSRTGDYPVVVLLLSALAVVLLFRAGGRDTPQNARK
ncbi:apolipoprotein N-acyltransferase [uncultured Roseobacter sp.]|uniref:apolipoprotein N-acyltransferase n=1 Tax=uncultured Roseobacter sp. TaxID=114847 RepID=UPI00261B0F6E|nr:apolipoprotein N-acyltransferase [uncultured Roseobacter sp.]